MPYTPQFLALVQSAIAHGLVARRHRLNPELAIVTSPKHPHLHYQVTRCWTHRKGGIFRRLALACFLADSGKLPFRQPTNPPTRTGRSMLTIAEYHCGTPEALEIVKRDARTARIVHFGQRRLRQFALDADRHGVVLE
jgi:hypothetical protein